MSERADGGDSAMVSHVREAGTATSTAAFDPPTASPPLPTLPPKVTSAVPAMFVPLDVDLTQPFNPPRDRIERARIMLESIDFHSTGVRRGMLHLADMDRRRILAEAELAKAQVKAQASEGVYQSGSKGLDPDEADAMIACMEAPAQPNVDYNITDEYLASHVPRFSTPNAGREDTVRQLQQVVENAVRQLGGYEKHISGIRSRWQTALDKEQKLLDARFGELSATAKANSNTTTKILEATHGAPMPPQEEESTTATGTISGAPPKDSANTKSEDVAMGGT